MVVLETSQLGQNPPQVSVTRTRCCHSLYYRNCLQMRCSRSDGAAAGIGGDGYRSRNVCFAGDSRLDLSVGMATYVDFPDSWTTIAWVSGMVLRSSDSRVLCWACCPAGFSGRPPLIQLSHVVPKYISYLVYLHFRCEGFCVDDSCSRPGGDGVASCCWTPTLSHRQLKLQLCLRIVCFSRSNGLSMFHLCYTPGAFEP